MAYGVGVTSITGAATIKVSAANGAITLTDVGVLSVAAGTGVTVSASTGSVTVTNAGVTGFNGNTGSVTGVGTIAGTTNQITASASTGSVTLSLPQSIATTSAVQFGGLTVNGTLALTPGTTGSLDNTAIGATTASTLKITSETVAYTAVTTTPYTATNASNILSVQHAGAVSVTLPANTAGRLIRVKDESGNASTQNITVSPASGTIDGAATYVINTNYGKATFFGNGTNWFTI